MADQAAWTPCLLTSYTDVKVYGRSDVSRASPVPPIHVRVDLSACYSITDRRELVPICLNASPYMPKV